MSCSSRRGGEKIRHELSVPGLVASISFYHGLLETFSPRDGASHSAFLEVELMPTMGSHQHLPAPRQTLEGCLRRYWLFFFYLFVCFVLFFGGGDRAGPGKPGVRASPPK